MHSNRIVWGLICLGVAALVAAVLPACGGSDESIRLSYSIFFPPTHIQCQTAVAWAEEIERRTEGRLRIQIFPGGTLTSDNVGLDAGFTLALETFSQGEWQTWAETRFVAED